MGFPIKIGYYFYVGEEGKGLVQFKVPQNIDLADKIIGPLTMAQFLYLLLGGMVDYVLLQTVFPTDPVIFFVVAVPIAVFTLAMTFLKINDIPFPRFVQAALLYLTLPKQRMWHKSVDLTTPLRIEATKKKATARLTKTKIEKTELEQMANVLDTAGWAAVRDERLKEFVKGFGEKHTIITSTKSQAPNNKQ